MYFPPARLKVIRALLLTGPLALFWIFIQIGYTHHYAATAQFVLRNNQPGSDVSFGADIFGGGGKVGGGDLFLIQEYIQSPDMLGKLDTNLHLREAYRASNIWTYQRLSSGATEQDFLEYYRSLLTVSIDTNSSIITITIQGFDPALTLKQCDLTLKIAEEYLNEISRRVAKEQALSAQTHLDECRRVLEDKREAILKFQHNRNLFMPGKDGDDVMAIVASLETNLADKKAQLAGTGSYLNPSSPAYIQAQSEITALESQITSERRRLIEKTSQNKPALNESLEEFKLLELDFELASKGYSDALSSLQNTRIAVAQNIKSVVIIAHPTKPEIPSYPRVWVWMLGAAVVNTMAVRRFTTKLLRGRSFVSDPSHDVAD